MGQGAASRPAQWLFWPKSVLRGGRAPGPELEAELAAAKGSLGVSDQVAPEGVAKHGADRRWAVLRGLRTLPVSLQLLQICCIPLRALWTGREHRSPSAPAMWSLPPTPHPAAHQVEVGEDAGGPVLLSHKQQHLVIDEVAVLLERVAQA